MLVGMCLYINVLLTQTWSLCHDLNSRFFIWGRKWMKRKEERYIAKRGAHKWNERERGKVYCVYCGFTYFIFITLGIQTHTHTHNVQCCCCWYCLWLSFDISFLPVFIPKPDGKYTKKIRENGGFVCKWKTRISNCYYYYNNN